MKVSVYLDYSQRLEVIAYELRNSIQLLEDLLKAPQNADKDCSKYIAELNHLQFVHKFFTGKEYDRSAIPNSN